jgi:hypothetical protein
MNNDTNITQCVKDWIYSQLLLVLCRGMLTKIAKPLKHKVQPMIRKTIACIILFVLLQGCGLNGIYSTWRNSQIDPDKRAEIEVLNNKLINSIKFNDTVAVKSMLSDTLKKATGNEIDTVINSVSPAFETDQYTVLDEYNVHNLVSGVSNSLSANKKSDNDYTINYVSLTKEAYISLLLVKDPTGDILVTVVYGNYDGKWEINILEVGRYRYYNKTAMDYYKLAKLNYKKSYFIDAADNLFLAYSCLKPATEIFHYKKEKEVKDYYDKVLNEIQAKYHLPITLENIPGKPQVFGIYPQLMEGGYFTTVRYLSSINMNDSIALRKENDKVQIEVKKIFSGISVNKKATLYQAFNQMPDGEHPIKHYGFVDRAKMQPDSF